MQFRSAVDSDASSAKAYWGLARAHENLGQFNETLEALRKAVELDSANLEAKAKLGNYFLLVQPPMIAQAEKARDEILAADAAFIEGHVLTASIMAAQGKPEDEVTRAIGKAVDLNPKRIETYISLERYLVTREKIKEAEAALKKGLAEAPDAVAGFVEYGRFLTYAERDTEAEANFQKAIALDPAHIEAREAIADFYVTSHQIDKAERAFQELVQIQENSPESRLVLADFYLKTDRSEESVKVLNGIVADSPEYVRARYKLSEIYLETKDYSKAGEQLAALLEINDEDVEALLLRARMSIQQGKGEVAVQDLETVLKKRPSGREPLFLMSQARLSLGQVDQANAFIGDLDRYHPSYLKTNILKIQAAFTVGDAPTALKRANELLAKANATKPSADNDQQMLKDLRIRALSSRGLANLDLGKLGEAKADLQEIVKVSPRSSAAVVNLAKVLVAERNQAGALELYEKALTLDGQNFDAATGVVGSAIQLNQTPRAHATADRLIAANANRNDVLAAVHYLKSTIYSAEKDRAAAERELLSAIELDENYMPAYAAYASLLAEQNRTNEAIAQYKKVIEKRPSAQTFTLLGILEEARGNSGEAETAYRRALEIAPESPIAANNLAWLIAENQGNLDEALQLATMAVNKNQSVAGFYDTLGWVYLKKGLASPAVEKLKKAVALDEASTQKSGAVPNPGYRQRLQMALAKSGGKNGGPV